MMKKASVPGARRTSLVLGILMGGWAAILGGIPAEASAVEMMYTFTGTGHGTLNGSAFPNSAFVITAFADTDSRQSLPYNYGYFIDHTSASIAIAGLGDFGILTGTRTFVSFPSGLLGFSRAGIDGYDLYSDLHYGSLGPWDMLTPFGPVAGTAVLQQWDSYTPLINTTGGILIFPGRQPCDGIFTAVVTPEPATLSLLALGGLAVVARRRRAAKR